MPQRRSVELFDRLGKFFCQGSEILTGLGPSADSQQEFALDTFIGTRIFIDMYCIPLTQRLVRYLSQLCWLSAVNITHTSAS